MATKSKVNIIRIIKVTPGKNHCWCLSDVGVIRKPINVVRAMFYKTDDVVMHKQPNKFIKLLIKIILSINHFIDNLFFREK